MFLPIPIGGFSTTFKHGARQLWAVQVLQRAINSALLSKKEAAAKLGLTEPQWSRQCSCEEGAHVSYQRLFELPPTVLKALFGELAREMGWHCVDDAELVRAVSTMQSLAAAIEARPQLSMDLGNSAPERKRA